MELAAQSAKGICHELDHDSEELSLIRFAEKVDDLYLILSDETLRLHFRKNLMIIIRDNFFSFVNYINTIYVDEKAQIRTVTVLKNS